MTEMADEVSPSTSFMWQAVSVGKLGFEPALTIPERLVVPDSWAGHLPFAFWIVAMAQPRRIVELGVHTGNSYCSFAQAVSKYRLETDCFGIDHWFGDEQAGTYGEDVYADLKSWHDPRFGHFSKLLRMSFLEGRNFIEDRSVDLLHIDGLHTYEAVKEDFETWIPKMSDRCIVLFHDTNVFQEGFGVHKFFKEIKAKYPAFEFLHSNGLGVAYTGSCPVEALDPVFALLFRDIKSDSSLTSFRSYFSRLGNGLVSSVRLDETRRWLDDTVRQLAAIDEDRENVRVRLKSVESELTKLLEHMPALEEKAVKWDRLAVNTGGALSIDLNEISNALNVLYNSDNSQALRDREILRTELNQLITTGGLLPTPEKPITHLHILLSKWKQRLIEKKAASDNSNSSQTFEADPPPIEEDASIVAIRASGLFDEEFYALTEQARAGGQDPLMHYLQTGEEQRISPSKAFDPDYYARFNRDVAASGYGLLRHYVLFGQAEERMCLTPAKRMNLPPIQDVDRPRLLLLIEPELPLISRAFAINIASRLGKNHDVVLLMQEGDPQSAVFEKLVANTVFFPNEFDIEAVDRNEVLELIVRHFKPEFGVALSVRSRINIRGLSAAGLGMVQMIDEYSSAVYPAMSAYQFLAWAHRLVFPSQSVFASFRQEHPYLSHRQLDILPPPSCGDRDSILVSGQSVFDVVLKDRIRPKAWADDIIVMSSGPLEPGSGVETFVALAAQCAARENSGKRLRFVWVSPEETDLEANEYTRKLQEQIQRVDVASSCSIVTVVEGVEAAAQFVDLYVLTTPVDAMSHSALSAIKNGKPVVCFEGASTIADGLMSEPATANLVVPYMDVHQLSETVVRLSDNEEYYNEMSKSCIKLNSSTFNFDKYIAYLVDIGRQAQADARLISQSTSVIRAADPPAFNDVSFADIWNVDDHPQDYLHTYLLRWCVSRSETKGTSPDLRRPYVGFNPAIYFEDVVDTETDLEAFGAWIEAGRPEGRWTHSVLRLDDAKPKAIGVRALLHGHFYYVDLIDEFLKRLQVNESPIDLLLTVPTEEKKNAALQSLSRVILSGQAKVEVVPNVGRDIGPFLSGLDKEILAQYEVVGHIHGKKSPHLKEATGSNWRDFLWEHIVGGQIAAADACLAAFKSDAGLGLIFPEDPYLVAWDSNFETGAELIRKMGRSDELPKTFEWPIGTTFWARSKALEPLFELGIKWEDYPPEPLPGDGTLLHALERIIPFAVEQAGFEYLVTHFEGAQR